MRLSSPLAGSSVGRYELAVNGKVKNLGFSCKQPLLFRCNLIDFSNDGYARSNRKKASCNLRDTDHAKERYEELVNVVRFGKEKLHYIAKNDYFEGHIDPDSGADWNQYAPVDTTPSLEDFKKTVADYLAWEVANLLKNKKLGEDCVGK